VRVDEGDHFLNWRSSSARAKYALASFRISLVLRNSRTSLEFLEGPGRARPVAPSGAASQRCNRAWPRSTRSPPTATGAGPWPRTPGARRARSSPGNTSVTSSCWLNLLKRRSLLNSRGGSQHPIALDANGFRVERISRTLSPHFHGFGPASSHGWRFCVSHAQDQVGPAMHA
jgi:hypothetical protein